MGALGSAATATTNAVGRRGARGGALTAARPRLRRARPRGDATLSPRAYTLFSGLCTPNSRCTAALRESPSSSSESSARATGGSRSAERSGWFSDGRTNDSRGSARGGATVGALLKLTRFFVTMTEDGGDVVDAVRGEGGRRRCLFGMYQQQQAS